MVMRGKLYVAVGVDDTCMAFSMPMTRVNGTRQEAKSEVPRRLFDRTLQKDDNVPLWHSVSDLRVGGYFSGGA